MRKELLLVIISTTISMLLALGIIRWIAPQLLGLPTELQLVKTTEEIPPFFDGIFRYSDLEVKELLIKDPFIIRGKPFFPNMENIGPHDILGFRNVNVPYVADIITIGDSQTYGNNALIEKNWPSLLKKKSDDPSVVVYNMSVGSWGAAQYLEIFTKALFFQPRMVIVAFYTGNDPLDSFIRVYGDDRLDFLRPDTSLTPDDVPKVNFPPPRSTWWEVTFDDGVKTIFTPKFRHYANFNHPAIHAGYAIMLETVRKICVLAQSTNTKLIIIVIPTKELVYSQKIEKSLAGDPPVDYVNLIRDERANIDSFTSAINEIQNVMYVDVIKPLQQSAISSKALYPEDINGHPIAEGYEIIASTVFSAIRELLPMRSDGVVSISDSNGRLGYYLIRNKKMQRFANIDILKGNGWDPATIPAVSHREIATMKRSGSIDLIDKEKYGSYQKN